MSQDSMQRVIESIEDKLERLEGEQRAIEDQIELKRQEIKDIEEMLANLRELQSELFSEVEEAGEPESAGEPGSARDEA
jgi:predicted  nucleic acid-binding Zn-ribbon protein